MNLYIQVLLSSLVQGKENQVEEVSEVSNKNWNIHTNLLVIHFRYTMWSKDQIHLEKETKCFSLKKKKRVITRATPLLKEWPSSIKNVSSYVYIADFFSAGNFIFIYALINQDNMIHLRINVILNNFSNVFTNFP